MENTPIRWQRLAALSRRFVAPRLNGRLVVRLLSTLALAVGFVLPQAQAQSGAGSITGQCYSETMNSASYAQNFQQEEFGIQMAVGVKGIAARDGFPRAALSG